MYAWADQGKGLIQGNAEAERERKEGKKAEHFFCDRRLLKFSRTFPVRRIEYQGIREEVDDYEI